MPQEFWSRLDELLAAHELVLDRPRGTAHPRYPDLVFPLDYGYLAGTAGGDGDGIDVWHGSAGHSDLVAIVCTVDMNKHDAEYKLVIGATEADLRTIEAFHNGRYQSAILVRRPPA
jgi:inorganic pyrophosphatase